MTTMAPNDNLWSQTSQQPGPASVHQDRTPHDDHDDHDNLFKTFVEQMLSEGRPPA